MLVPLSPGDGTATNQINCQNMFCLTLEIFTTNLPRGVFTLTFFSYGFGREMGWGGGVIEA